MFATNYPVDFNDGFTIDRLIEGFLMICEGFNKNSI